MTLRPAGCASRPPKRDLLSLFDLGAETIRALVDRALELKRLRGRGEQPQPLRGRTIGMIFEKASTRTRVSFEVAAFELGGHAVYLSPQGTQIGRGEPLRDTARVLGAYCHAIVIRTYGQQVVEEMARFAPVPVINGLTDLLHPTQVLADLMTVEELRGPGALQPGRLRFCWIGDANNMAHSWMNAAALLGLDLSLAHPWGRDPDAEVLRRAQAEASRTGARIVLGHDVVAAAAGRDVLSTDVWASMGEEPESRAEQDRLRQRFAGFCIDEELMRKAAPGAMVLHCLPAHRGEEITDAVLEGEQSAVFVQAENRLHMAKALLEHFVCPG
ncbi:MAG: ornithine carbamoyltransferase [Myxococcales bacterium]|nr:ornithine carbamoyltransferase [Myxococcota bacterium]MDW8282097.1 ornithine carbamoyltransferase [Myxococcales bacterium]